MVFLILNIVFTSSVFVVFRISGNLRSNLFRVIAVNYISGAFLGILILNERNLVYEILNSSWIWLSSVIGITFVGGFLLIGKSSRTSGVTATAMAAKMSVLIPVLFSVVYDSESLEPLKISGLILAFLAFIMSVYRSDGNGITEKSFLLPLALFVYIGCTDLALKYSQSEYVDSAVSPAFTLSIFVTAAICSFILCFFQKDRKVLLSGRELVIGVILGFFNYLSIYCLFLALNSPYIDSSVVFTASNGGIIILSAITGMVFFSENLKPVNYAGLVFSVVSLVILLGFN